MKNVSFHRYVISLICVAILSGGGVYIWQKVRLQHNPHRISPQWRHQMNWKSSNAFDQIRANYYQEVDEDVLVEGALKGMTDALGDPYTTYLSESAANELISLYQAVLKELAPPLPLSTTIQKWHKPLSRTPQLRKTVCV